MTMKKIIRSSILVMLIVALMPVGVFASSLPYKDIKKKDVGKDAQNAIVYIYKHGGYKDVVKGKKFHPYKEITRGQCIIVLKNLFGAKNVPIEGETAKTLKKTATVKWLKNKLIAVAKKIGLPLKWGNKTKKKLTRAWASQFIRNFCKFDPALAPCQ